MPLRDLLFDTVYRLGSPIWQIPTPPEVKDVIDGDNALPAGRALDLGCGTSPNVAYLAQRGWQITGVDVSATAIRKAQQHAQGIAGATFVVADVTRLTESGVTGPFDLVIDNGCYHTLSDEGKQAYARQVGTLMASGARLIMWEALIRLRPNEIRERFADKFIIERVEDRNFVTTRMKIRFNIKAKWYWLQRR
jgi:SAM-dependent methyltransferase